MRFKKRRHVRERRKRMDDWEKKMESDPLYQLQNALLGTDYHRILECALACEQADPLEPLEGERLELVLEGYQRCIDEGMSAAMLNLGAMYYVGRGVDQDFAQAVRYYTMAAELGNTIAMCNLGYCHYYGRSIPVDYERAYQCFAQSALLSNNFIALYKLGDMYQTGRYVTKNVDTAFSLYIRSMNARAETEDNDLSIADVYQRLGNCLLHGTGVEPNEMEALKCFQMSEYYFLEKIQAGDIFAESSLRKVREALEECRNKIHEKLHIEL